MEHALSLDATPAKSWNRKGLALRDLHRPEEAIAAFDEALVRDDRLGTWHFIARDIIGSVWDSRTDFGDPGSNKASSTTCSALRRPLLRASKLSQYGYCEYHRRATACGGVAWPEAQR